MASRSALPLLVLVALAGLFAMSYSALSAASVGDPQPEPAAVTLPPAPTPAVAPRPAKPKKPRWRSLASSRRLGHGVAIVRRWVPLRARPNGRVVARAWRATEFGDQR